MNRDYHKHLNNCRDKLHELYIPEDAGIFENHHLHHTALMPGYLPVWSVKWMEYSGKFGTGFIVLRHNPNSTKYVLKDYWITGEDPKETQCLYQRILNDTSASGTTGEKSQENS